MNRAIQFELAKACATGSMEEIKVALKPFFSDSIGWKIAAEKFAIFLETGNPTFNVIQSKGNKKLPFAKFSSLPAVTCPGAGACLDICYSFKAWRYPAGFFVQAMNTVLLRSKEGREEIRKAFLKVRQGSTFRLYVDGDFSDLEILQFWMGNFYLRPDVSAYGYSKSWEIFLAYQSKGWEFPPNYRLNLSSGSKYAAESGITRAVEKLSCVRGWFLAVEIPDESQAPIGKRTADYNRAVRDAAKALGHERVFVCPGLCGSCTSAGHACGAARFSGIPIGIGIHA